MPDVVDHLPYLVIIDKPFPCRHPRHADAIFDHPFQLTVSVLLNIGRAKVRHGWRHPQSKCYSRRATVETVAHLAVMLEVFSSELDTGRIVWNWILPILPTND